MTKQEIIDLIKKEIDLVDDYDDKIDVLAELIEPYRDREDFDETILEIYKSIEENNEEIYDERLVELENILDSTNELIINEQYEDVVNILKPYEDLVNDLFDINDIDRDKFEVGCFFNEIEKNLFFYLESDPNKDIHLINPFASEYYSRLALVYHNSLKYNEALECYKKILAFNPCSNQALLGMAYLAYRQENYLTALEYIKEFAKYAFVSDLIFEAYQLLTNIYIQLAKYDYACIFAYIGSSFAMNENLAETMLNIYLQYKNEVKFDLDDDRKLDKFLKKEEFIYFPNNDVMEILYSLLEEYRGKKELEEVYYQIVNLILSLVDDEELAKEVENQLKEYN